MTPQERALVEELFDRLSALEKSPREAEAEQVIRRGLARAPNAAYGLVQTVLVQDEALKRAQDRILELENSPSRADESFLDRARRDNAARGSVPSVAPASKWNSARSDSFASAPPMQAPQQSSSQFGGGGSFLGAAAAAAVGVIGGSLLFNGLRNMMGGGAHAFGAPESGDRAASPWGQDANRGELAREAGVEDIGGRGSDQDYGTRSASLYDGDRSSSGNANIDQSDDFESGDFDGGDLGGDSFDA